MSRIKNLWDKIKQRCSSDNKWIYTWVFLGIVFMLIVHVLFSLTGPNWLQAKWGAGELLTYVGTISLGLLTVWQNKRFKEENDKSQERLERLSQQANELAIVSKILEYEAHRIEKVKASLEKFYELADAARLVAKVTGSVQSKTIGQEMVRWHQDIFQIASDIDMQLENDQFTPHGKLKEKISLVSEKICNVCRLCMESSNPEGYILREYEDLTQMQEELYSLWQNYIALVDKTYSHLLFDNLTLDEIRKKRIDPSQENFNGK